ncbi:hypothetical protein TREES_T100017651 [Tupaia chinensis]|uniref:Uncharacterized protein n=1 Tax=Tupaia chinensis TaxID=246437 RepID=L9L3N2_TUPCH|nr:hypothetical protein TREES_T100017651 [Tupaia chinensis]
MAVSSRDPRGSNMFLDRKRRRQRSKRPPPPNTLLAKTISVDQGSTTCTPASAGTARSQRHKPQGPKGKGQQHSHPAAPRHPGLELMIQRALASFEVKVKRKSIHADVTFFVGRVASVHCGLLCVPVTLQEQLNRNWESRDVQVPHSCSGSRVNRPANWPPSLGAAVPTLRPPSIADQPPTSSRDCLTLSLLTQSPPDQPSHLQSVWVSLRVDATKALGKFDPAQEQNQVKPASKAPLLHEITEYLSYSEEMDQAIEVHG